MNDLLRRALEEARLTEEEVAKRLDVDPKTVRRWLSGRIPYPRHRATLCDLLDRTADDLWPHLSAPRPLPEPPGAQILATYPHRWAVPRAVWQHHFASARQEIGILAYAGLFLAEDQGVMRTIADKARDGVTVRILLDNKPAYERQNVTSPDPSPVITLPLNGAKSLTLEVDYGLSNDTQDRFLWLQPALLRPAAK